MAALEQEKNARYKSEQWRFRNQAVYNKGVFFFEQQGKVSGSLAHGTFGLTGAWHLRNEVTRRCVKAK